MIPPRIHAGYLLAWSSLLYFIGPVEARKGLGSAIGETVGTVDLKLTGKERALFALAIVFGVLTLFQVLGAVLFLKAKKQPPWEDSRERLLYGGLALAGTVWLTIYYALDATFYTRGSPSWDVFPSGIIPTRIFFFKFFIMISCVAVSLLIHYRRNSFNSALTTPSQPDARQSIVYTILPIIYLFAMFVLTIAEVGLYSYYFSHQRLLVMPTWLLNGIRATSTLFAVAYVLLAVTIFMSAGRLENQIKQTKEQVAAPSEPTVEEKRQDELDSTLFGPICHFLCFHAFITLIFNILLIYGLVHLFFYTFLVGFGEPPEEKETQVQQVDTTRPQKPIPAWARPE